jgi:quinolinate synthase
MSGLLDLEKSNKMTKSELQSRIRELKNTKGVTILAHNYQRPEIQEIADFLGDSLELARKATTLDCKTIVFCGVHFMVESAKILNPEKTFLLPEINAGCPLADCATADQVRDARQKYPNSVFIVYINTSAAVKAECDCVCTSANALKIILHYKDRDIVYLPDKNLAAYAEHLLKRPIIKWDGQCYVHDNLIKIEDVKDLKEAHPNAIVLAHPECPMSILTIADLVTGTNGMIVAARERPEREFIVVTERGLVDRLQSEVKNKIFFSLEYALCGQMKLTSLFSVYEALEKWQYEITVDEHVAQKARVALDRMMELSK